MSPGKKQNDSKLFFRILLVTSFGTPCRSQCICAFVCMCLFICGCILCMSLRLCVWAPLQMVMVTRHGMVSPLSPLATVHPLKHSRFTLFLPFPRFTCFFRSVYIFPALLQTIFASLSPDNQWNTNADIKRNPTYYFCKHTQNRRTNLSWQCF